MQRIGGLYVLVESIIMDLLDSGELGQSTDKRQRKALEQLTDAAQLLYAACVNLGLVEED